MSTARQDVVDYLRDYLPDIKVLDALEALTNAKRPCVMVSRSSIELVDVVDQRDDVLTVWLVSPYLDLVKAEADLDEHVDDVLAAIEAHDFLHWTAGERDVFAEAWHAFRITVPHRTLTNEE